MGDDRGNVLLISAYATGQKKKWWPSLESCSCCIRISIRNSDILHLYHELVGSSHCSRSSLCRASAGARGWYAIDSLEQTR